MKRNYLKNCVEKGKLEAGCDEAGRGCLAGPVVAAAVILPKGFKHPLLNDSKQLNEGERQALATYIKAKALTYGIAFVDHTTIDEINILNASFLAMHRAVDQLLVKPELLVIDGNRFNAYPNIAHSCQIKGDGRFKHIAAASILAKTSRDAYMEKLHAQYPNYHWLQNKGYPTKAHRAAIAEHGASPHHRLSFRLLPNQEAGTS
jgi:ribonuclease HII